MGERAKRLTVVVTPEIEAQIEDMKREVYFDRTKSEMIRELVDAGIRSSRAKGDYRCTERKNA